MATTEYYKRMISYDAWATKETLRSLQQAPEQDNKATALLAHVVAAHYVWYCRVTGRDTSSIAVWPDSPLETLAQAVEERYRDWIELLHTAPEESLQRVVEYTNTKGVAYTNTVADILSHVLLHGMYHRAQIASLVKASGGIPASTDFIVYARG